jgi:hypothetical protein
MHKGSRPRCTAIRTFGFVDADEFAAVWTKHGFDYFGGHSIYLSAFRVVDQQQSWLYGRAKSNNSALICQTNCYSSNTSILLIWLSGLTKSAIEQG